MKQIALIPVVLFGGAALKAQTDTIYPGDANYDGYCNHEDVVIIGLRFGVTGAPRDTNATTWGPWASYTWQDTLPNTLVTTNYADCNGDGVINEHDVAVIDSNFGFTHDTSLAAINGFNPVGATSQDPHLAFTMRSFVDSILVSDTVILDVELGTQGMVANLTGFTFSASFTPELVDTIMVNFDSSMLSPSTARLDFEHTDFTHGDVSLTSVLSNQTLVSVAGKVASLIIVMEGNIAGKTTVLKDTFILCPDRIIAVDDVGNVLPIYGECDSFIVYDLDSRIDPGPTSEFKVFPNPSPGIFTVSSNHKPMQEIMITNTLGQCLYRRSVDGVREEIIFRLDVSPGLYFVSITSGSAVITHKLNIIR
jgi:hypothetical protein